MLSDLQDMKYQMISKVLIVQFFIILDMQWSAMAVNVEYLKLHHHFSIVLNEEFGNFIRPLGILNEFKLS